MNGIHKYLMAVAIQSIRQAAGKLIAKSELDPVEIASSLSELLTEMERIEESPMLKSTCEVDYKGGWENTRPTLTDAGINPIFIKPAKNNSA